MSMYDFKQLLQRWEQEELTPEQAIGQLLLHLQALRDRLGAVERRLAQERGGKGEEKRKDAL